MPPSPGNSEVRLTPPSHSRKRRGESAERDRKIRGLGNGEHQRVGVAVPFERPYAGEGFAPGTVGDKVNVSVGRWDVKPVVFYPYV